MYEQNKIPQRIKLNIKKKLFENQHLPYVYTLCRTREVPTRNITMDAEFYSKSIYS